MLSFNPGKRVRELHAGFVVAVECAEVMAKTQQIGNVEIGLARDAGKAIVAPSPLKQNRIYESRLDGRVPGADQRLVPGKSVAPGAGRADAASVQRLADQQV